MQAEPGRRSHRLSVVWFTDLVGYSALSSRDQDRAVDLVGRFQAVVTRTLAGEDGRVVKFVGDAALLESPSAEAAIEAATALHAEMGDSVRTGIHLGDVVVGSDGDLYGDGVNGAQRIQSQAEPGQIVVSEDVWRRLRNRPAYAFEALGERQLKGVEPMELFRLVSVAAAQPATSSASGRTAASAEADAAGAPRSVAVLPFTNMSPQADNEYFSDGVTEEILTLLSRVEGLKVISRTSVMQYKGTVKPMRQIGRELGVATILEGSVRQAGSRVRIAAQLIDAATDEHLWAERYDRDLEDIFAIQSDVAERIVEALRLRLTSRERTRLAEKPTDSLEAYNSYLKGRYFLSRRTEASLRQAIDEFHGAVTADPGFAQAWVGLADGLVLLEHYGAAPGRDVLGEARAAAEKALLLDPRLGEAHISLGFIANTEWKWDEADRHFRRGLELSPGYATGYHWFGTFLITRGRLEEAITTLGRALELDPLSIPVHMGVGVGLWCAGRGDEALEIHRKALRLDPSFTRLHGNVAEMLLALGRFEEALEALGTLSRLDPDQLPPAMLDELRAGYAAGGERGYWESLLAALRPQVDRRGVAVRFELAQACAQLGRADEAFEHLDRLVAERHPAAMQIANHETLAPLRSDPRFHELERKLGLE